MPADPAGRDATAPEVEAVARAWWAHDPEAFDRLGGPFRDLQLTRAEAAIAALDRVRADSARGEDQEERCPRCWLTVRVGMHCEDEACPYPRTSAGQVDDDRPSRGEDHEVITTKAGTRCVCGHSVIQHVPECMGFMPDRHGGRSARCGCERMLPVPSPVDDTARLREILHAVRAWENDAPLDRDHPDDCDADFLRYIGRVARMDLSVDAGKPEANDER